MQHIVSTDWVTVKKEKKNHCDSIYEEVLHLVVRHVTDWQDGGFVEGLVQLVKQNL